MAMFFRIKTDSGNLLTKENPVYLNIVYESLIIDFEQFTNRNVCS